METGYEDDVPFVPRHQSLLERIWAFFAWPLVIVFTLAFFWLLMTFAAYLVLFAVKGGH